MSQRLPEEELLEVLKDLCTSMFVQLNNLDNQTSEELAQNTLMNALIASEKIQQLAEAR